MKNYFPANLKEMTLSNCQRLQDFSTIKVFNQWLYLNESSTKWCKQFGIHCIPTNFFLVMSVTAMKNWRAGCVLDGQDKFKTIHVFVTDKNKSRT